MNGDVDYVYYSLFKIIMNKNKIVFFEERV